MECMVGLALEVVVVQLQMVKLHSKGEDIFQSRNSFFTEYSIPWNKCAGICTDGAAACTSFKSGVVKQIKDIAPSAEWTHCFLHREALPAKNYHKNCTKC